MTNSTVAALCRSLGLSEPVPEYRFAPPRKWRADWAFLREKIMVEIEGGAWVQGRHTRGSGFVRDLEKYNRMAIMGYRLIRCLPKQWESGEALTWVHEAAMALKKTETTT